MEKKGRGKVNKIYKRKEGCESGMKQNEESLKVEQ
jgi:hypothetical protein